MATVIELNNPLVLDRITRLRDKATSSREFRQFVKEITMLLAAEATNDLPSEGIVLVIEMTFKSSALGMRETVVRRVRKASAAVDWGCKCD